MLKKLPRYLRITSTGLLLFILFVAFIKWDIWWAYHELKNISNLEPFDRGSVLTIVICYYAFAFMLIYNPEDFK